MHADYAEMTRDELEARCAALERARGVDNHLPLASDRVRLTAPQSRIVRAILKRGHITTEALFEVYAGHQMEPPDRNCLRAQISIIRRQLVPLGEIILTVRGHGYAICAEGAERLKAEFGAEAFE